MSECCECQVLSSPLPKAQNILHKLCCNTEEEEGRRRLHASSMIARRVYLRGYCDGLAIFDGRGKDPPRLVSALHWLSSRRYATIHEVCLKLNRTPAQLKLTASSTHSDTLR